MRPYIGLLLAVLVVLSGCAQSFQGTTMDPQNSTTIELPTNAGENVSGTFVGDEESRHAVTLEVANTSSERTEGLMYRQSLPRNHGMVFVYSDERPLTFWMKNTYVPLDIIFIDANGTVINVEHAAPQPNATDAELKRYGSDAPARYVVEMKRGFANRTGVGPGTQFVFNGSQSSQRTTSAENRAVAGV